MNHSDSEIQPSVGIVQGSSSHIATGKDPLSRTEQLIFALIINLENHYKIVRKIHTASTDDTNDETKKLAIEGDNTANIVAGLLEPIASNKELVKAMERHWSIDLTSGPVSPSTVFSLCGNDVNDALVSDAKKILNQNATFAKSKIEEIAFSYSLLVRFLPHLPEQLGRIESSLEDYQRLLPDYKRYFARLLEAGQNSRDQLAKTNIGYLINKTTEVMNRNNDWARGENDPVIRKHVNSMFFPVSDDYLLDDRQSTNWDEVGIDCANLAIETLINCANRFDYRKASNRPILTYNPFLAYLSAWLEPEIREALNLASEDRKEKTEYPDETSDEIADDTDEDNPGFNEENRHLGDLAIHEPFEDQGLSDERLRQLRLLADNPGRLSETETEIAKRKYLGKQKSSEISKDMNLSRPKVSYLMRLIEFKIRRYFGTNRDPVVWFQAIPTEIFELIPQEQREMLSYRCNSSYTFGQIAAEINKKYATTKWNRQNVSRRIQAWVGYIKRNTSTDIQLD